MPSGPDGRGLLQGLAGPLSASSTSWWLAVFQISRPFCSPQVADWRFLMVFPPAIGIGAWLTRIIFFAFRPARLVGILFIAIGCAKNCAH